MTHANAHILCIAFDPTQPLSLLTSLSYNGETSAPIRCHVDSIDKTILSIFNNALASDTPLLVVVAKLRNRASREETALTRNVKTAVRTCLEAVPKTQVITIAGELEEISNEIFCPRVGNIGIPWGRGGVELRFATFTPTIPHLPSVHATVPAERSAPAQWSL